MGLRSSINKNLTEIVELHEEILGELHQAVPHSEYTQPQMTPNFATRASTLAVDGPGHRRWTSVDGFVGSNNRMAYLQGVPGMMAEPQVAAEVAKVFAKKVLPPVFILALCIECHEFTHYFPDESVLHI